jgi:hypothetical protein
MDGSHVFESAPVAPIFTPTITVFTKRAKPTGIIVSAALGFLAGAAFWHFVGFWTFVNEAVFYKRADAVVVAGGRPMKSQSRQSGIAGPVSAQAGNCTLAALDRSAGEARVFTCDGPVAKFRPARGVQRADFADFGPTPVPTLISGAPTSAPAVSGWSARVDKADGVPTMTTAPSPQ